ncbi:MAG: fasciclin domain-containing protein [Odoribacter sp.]|nr:fasciclin domain-containing protein [Odoribacter sp.]
MRKLCNFRLISLSLILLWGCDKEFDKHYKRPDFLKGNAIEVMEDKGNFTHFIKAAEKVGYKGMLNGRELCTVMAPTDEAFEKYFARHGYSDVDAIPEEILEVLIPYHIVKNAFEETYFLAYNNVDGEPGNGRHYKYETYANEPIKSIINPLRGNRINIYGRSKYMPIISSVLFTTDNIVDAEADYKFFSLILIGKVQMINCMQEMLL